MRTRFNSPIEQLESRIAPAALISPTTVTYTDVDGDLVTVKLSKPVLTQENVEEVFAFSSGFAVNGPQQLFRLDLSAFAAVPGLGVALTAKLAGAGDGVAALGFLKAEGVDLGTVKLDGDLGRITAGNVANPTPSIKTFSALSMGRYGTTTQAPGEGSMESVLSGSGGSFSLVTDMVGVNLTVGGLSALSMGGSLKGVDAAARGVIVADSLPVIKIGRNIEGGVVGNGGPTTGGITIAGAVKSFTLGGSLLGSADGLGKNAFVDFGSLGTATVGGEVKGGSGAASGRFMVHGALGSLTVGALIGGAGDGSGWLRADAIGKLTIRGSVTGGSNFETGLISFDSATAVTIGDSLLGGTLNFAGWIEAGTLGTLKIGGDIRGGLAEATGGVQVAQALGSLSLGGSLLGGSAERTGYLHAASTGALTFLGGIEGGNGDFSGWVRIEGSTGAVKIGGNLQGGAGSYAGVISAQGSMSSLTIAGALRGSLVSDSSPDAFNGAVSVLGNVGSIKIGRELRGGVEPDSGVLKLGGNVASLSIGGSIFGGAANSSVPDFIDSDLISAAQIAVGGALGPVSVRGDMVGAAGDGGAHIFAQAGLGAVTLGGSLLGGVGEQTGRLSSEGEIGAVKLGGSLRGHGAESGAIYTLGSLRGLSVGQDLSSGEGVQSGLVFARFQLGPVTIGGDVQGTAANPVFIGARGNLEAFSPAAALGLASLKVAGSAEHLTVRVGSDLETPFTTADVQVGAVSVGGDWVQSSLIVGVDPVAGVPLEHTTEPLFLRIARIASITIGGGVYGQPGGASDYFAAEQIGKFTIAKKAVPIPIGEDVNRTIGNTDVVLLILGPGA